MDIDIDMTNCIRNQHTEDNAVNLIQQWKKKWQNKEQKSDLHKRKMVQRKLEL